MRKLTHPQIPIRSLSIKPISMNFLQRKKRDFLSAVHRVQRNINFFLKNQNGLNGLSRIDKMDCPT